MDSIVTNDAGKRLPHGIARERILDAAEQLFSEFGLDSVSFRDLAGAAGVSLSAIHYHFGSKYTVLSEIFARRAQRLVDRRVELLERMDRDENGAYELEGILDAFLRPAFEVTHGDRDDLFNRLLARIAVQPSEKTREIISRSFDENDMIFIAELGRTLPYLNQVDLHWRFHFLVGAMIYTMSDYGQLVGLSGGRCSASDTQAALENMVRTFKQLFASPPVATSDQRRAEPQLNLPAS